MEEDIIKIRRIRNKTKDIRVEKRSVFSHDERSTGFIVEEIDIDAFKRAEKLYNDLRSTESKAS